MYKLTKQEFWAKHEQAYEARNLSIVEYCHKAGLNRHTFQHYRNMARRVKRAQAATPVVTAPSRFLRVVAPAKPQSFSIPAEIVARLRLGNGVTLECLRWPDPTWLIKLNSEVHHD